MRYLTAGTVILALVVPCGTALAQPAVDQCSTPALPFGSSPSFISDIISVPDTISIVDTHVFVDISHTFIGDIVAECIAPVGTVVRLHDEGGLNDIAILVNFTDSGIPNGSDLYSCDCDMQPSGPGVMADYSGGVSAGDWTLTVEDVFPSSEDGTLNSWCLRLFDTAPPPPVNDFTCATASGSLIADLSWVNAGTYDSLNIFVNGTLVDTIPGDSVSYSTAPEPLPGFVDIAIEPVVGTATGIPRDCSIFLDGTPDAEVCEAPDTPISAALPPVVSIIDVPDSLDITLLEVGLDITHTFVGDLEVDSESPAGTTVRLHDLGGFAGDDIRLTYNDFGLVNGLPYDCDCFKQPSGPGAMADFNGEGAQGAWTLTVNDTASADDGVLNEWCVRVFSASPARPEFIRGDVNGDGIFAGLIDGLAALNFQFVPGSPVPPCAEASDANNDGTFNGLLDGLYILNAQFVPGSPLPPPPFPGCGLDDDNALGCAEPPICL